MKQVRTVLAAAILLVACVSPALAADENPLPKPDVLTEESVMTSKRLSVYDTIILRDLKVEGAAYTNIDDEEKPNVESMKPFLVRTVSDSLEMELKRRKLFKNVQKNGVAKGKAVILEGDFTEFNAGNRALRFWVGFGAGKTYLKMKGRLIDAETGAELATFEDRETGYRGSMGMENFNDLFPHQAKSLGENIANFLEKLY